VTLTSAATGAMLLSTTASSTGSFTLAGIPNGSYIVTPSSSAAVFTPASLAVTINGASNTTANFTAAGLIFYDNFSGTSLSPAWTVISRHGEYAQSETECNVPEMVSVANNSVTITTEVSPPAPSTLGTCGDFNTDGSVRHAPSSWPYITGDIQWTSLNFTYGTVEIQAQFPAKSTGLWPALWLLGANCQTTNIYTADVGYSTCPALYTSNYVEIDMTECYSSNWCQLAMAQPGSWPECIYSVDNKFHVFTLTWTPSAVTETMDGGSTGCSYSSSTYTIPSTPMFLLIQTQTGGVGGTPNNAQLPATFTINYVKVTQP
jgi:hypothetical protein